MACKAAMAFLCLTMQACGGMHRKGGEGERTHRGWCCEEGREVGNGCVCLSEAKGEIKLSIDRDEFTAMLWSLEGVLSPLSR